MPNLLDPIEIDPIHLQEDLQERMRRYLLTALPIHRRFPKLREQASKELSRSASLIKGPFLEALPDFPKGKSLEDLVGEGLLHPGFGSLDPEVFSRPLHIHQEEAMLRVIKDQENVVVATGTGSGKTECFFFPLLDALLKGDIKGKPGIRAILVYPLNALANDQLYRRLVPALVHQLKDYGITVGRYTGQTTIGRSREWFEKQYLEDDFFKRMFGNEIPSNWLLSREEMLDTPPHVLVTNYAMLEHLLLLPRNADLFNHADLRFLVLDEVHTYAGAQATEVSLLLRKLRNRYAPDSDIRCIGTSASLGTSDKAKKQVIDFAGRLFGSSFSRVITADREAHKLLKVKADTTKLSPSDWIVLHDVLREVRHLGEDEQVQVWNRRVEEEALAFSVEPTDGESLSQLLCEPLASDERVRSLSLHLSECGLESIAKTADYLFAEATDTEEAQNALKGLVALGAFARENENTFPLLPARYHLFTRGIEEATIELAHPDENDEHATNLRFRREFKDAKTDVSRYRLMTCRKCGELYFEGYEKGHYLSPEPKGRGWRRAVFWLKPKDVYVIPEDSTEEEAEERNIPQPVLVHLKKGEIQDLLRDHDDPSEWLQTHRARMDTPSRDEVDTNPDARPRVTICQSCGSQDRAEIITPFHPGDQALSTAISEVLYAHLPTSKSEETRFSIPGRGRNMLVFSDNRQDAAFFAPYLQRSHENMLVRRAIVKFLKREGTKSRLVGLADDLDNDPTLKHGLTNRDGIPVDRNDRPQVVRGKIFSEFCSPGGSRTSLEDLGIVRVEYSGLDLNALADRAGLPNEIGPNLIRWVLDSIRLNRAISMPSEIRASDEFVWGNYAQENRQYVLETADDQPRFKFLPRRRDDGSIYLNRYVDVLRDSLKLDNWEAILRGIWKALLSDPEGEILRTEPEGSPMRVLDHRFLAIRLREPDEPVYRCSKCSRISAYDLGGICTQWRCNGKTKVVDGADWLKEMERNHYHYLYTVLEDMPSLLVKEHTAAIASQVREEIEKNFKEGKINVLSSSTTMEMGIDLGDLEGVMLRNVPPEISNYQQRAGRAGRRAQAAPVSITYARNRRYDQDVFEHAEEFLEKEPRTPFVHLGNSRLFQRHQFSILVGRYLAGLGLNGTGLQIGELFGLPKFNVDNQGGGLVPEGGRPAILTEENEDAFNSTIADWINSKEAAPAKLLCRDLLTSLKPELDEEEFKSLERVSDVLEEAFLDAIRRLANTFGQRFRHYKELAEQMMESGNLQRAAREQNRAFRWANQPIVNFLSKYGLIPTYSFPVDNIELEVLQGNRWGKEEIELSRDARLGVVEYAPGAEVVAGGRVWTSRAIPYTPREFMPPFHYKICDNCRNIESWEDSSLIPSHCSSCEVELKGAPRCYIEPTGFTTSISESNGKEPGPSRELPPRAMETQLIGNASEKLFRGTDLLKVDWACQPAQDGRMVVINKGNGEGYVKCGCGYSHAVTRNKRRVEPHRTPYTDQPCENAPSAWRFDLAHTFHTDVLQIRGNVTVPYPEIPEGELGHSDELNAARDGVARSVTEAIRLAACELVSIPEREMSGTFRWLPNGGLELILYDNVPGGAGYTVKVVDCKASQLIRYAIEKVLTCPADCSTSCSKCLRSFSNQAYWDEFRRHEAIQWLKRVLKVKRDDPMKLGGEEIKVGALKELCEKADTIGILRDRLGGFSGPIETAENGREAPLTAHFPEWNQINRWLADGKSITALCHHLPDFKDQSRPRARRLAETLLPLVKGGNLVLRKTLPAKDAAEQPPQMIIIDSTQPEAVYVYDLGGKGAVLDQLWSTDGTIIARKVPREEAKELLDEGTIITPEALDRPAGIQRFHYPSQQPRQLSRDFEFLGSGTIKTLEITDRYMVGQDWSADYLKDFLTKIGQLFTTPPETVVLRFGPVTPHEDRKYWSDRMTEIIAKASQLESYKESKFRPILRAHSQTVSNFHDRRVSARFEEGATKTKPAATEGEAAPKLSRRERQRQNAGKAPKSRTIIAELTGGISMLMNPQQETTVYVFTEK
ncbi:DEAD/DEAH box helicase [Verrucomicrobiales bacterium]|nr:DEAD/DEAH box helicase [Verrucomicrobiales bacterium]